MITDHPRLRRFGALTLGGALLLAACGGDDDEAGSSTTEPAAASTTTVETTTAADEGTEAGDDETMTDGTWLLDGYGQVVVVENAEATAAYVPAADWCSELSDVPPLFGIELTGPDTGVIDFGKTFPAVRIDLPAACDNPTAEVPPEAVIEGFVDIMDRHYPFFVERGIDWETSREELLDAAATAADTDEAAAIVANFIATMDDGHMFIDAQPSEPGPGDALEMTLSEALVEANRLESYLAATQVELADGAILHGELLPTVGYLKITRMAGYADNELEDLSNYAAFLTEALTELEGYDKLIIDLRGNGGGSDELSIETISRFVDEPLDLYTKEAYNTPTSIQTVSVEPSTDVGFKGEAVVLIDGATASAAEILGAGMYQIGATVIGTPSDGIFSDVNPMVLPGGFDFGMSNEIYRDLEGVSYEVRGVPRTIETTAAEAFDAALTAEELAALPEVEALDADELEAATTGVGALETLYGSICIEFVTDAGLEAEAPEACTDIFTKAIERNGDDVVERLVAGTASPEIILLPILEEVLAERLG